MTPCTTGQREGFGYQGEGVVMESLGLEKSDYVPCLDN